MISIPNLEWHAARACNLSCEGCLTFSDYPHSSIIDLKTLEKWYSAWNKRIAPKKMAIIGGEPLLNKQIVDIIYMTRDMWNRELNDNFELITNGFLLYKYPDLPKALEETQCELGISIHHYGSEYTEIIEKQLEIVRKWQESYNFKVNIFADNKTPYTKWMLPLKLVNGNIEPQNDNNIEGSWENCVTGQDCWQLFEGNIYKCPLVAYLNSHKQKFGLSSNWDQYLSYRPLTPDCSDEEIIEFFNRKAESCCGMCPSQPPPMYEKPDPIKRKKVFKIKRID